MPGMSGTELLAVAQTRWPDTVRMMLTGTSELEVAKKAINNGGIYRFLSKPISAFTLAVEIRKALEVRDLRFASRRMLMALQKQVEVFQELEDIHPEMSSKLRGVARAVLCESPSSAEDLEVFLDLLRHDLTVRR
jgi:response regulator RpfG family c-di-GMP phosphodiesterase